MTHGLYGMWYMETQLFLVPSIKECPVEYSQAFYRSGLATEVKRISQVLGNLSQGSQT